MHSNMEHKQETDQNTIHVSTTALKPRGGIKARMDMNEDTGCKS